MTITPRIEKILWGKASAMCSYPNCFRELIAEEAGANENVVLGEMAHIVSRRKNGPRGMYAPPGGDIDGYGNLILLCREHHQLVDGQEKTYPVDKLVQMRTDHERWVREQLSREKRYLQVHKPQEFISETVHSTLLPVIQMPRHIYRAHCEYSEEKVKGLIVPTQDSGLMLPYIIRGGNLITFANLRDEGGPFQEAIDPGAAERDSAPDWWNDPDHYRWYVTLLNRALNKLTGRKGLNLDKEHSRYYFEPREDGKVRSVRYLSLQGRRTSRMVVWRPKFRHSEEYKNYWEHLAVGLRFHKVARSSWCLSIRPERRFTQDGYEPLTPRGIGKRSTSKTSHMYNIDVLTEVHFWRQYLSAGKPRIIFKFGEQNLIVDTETMSAEARWPGVTDDARPFKYSRFQEDLFTLAEYHEAMDDWEEPEEWEDEYDE